MLNYVKNDAPKYIFCLFKAILYMEGDFSGGGTEMLKKKSNVINRPQGGYYNKKRSNTEKTIPTNKKTKL